MLRYLKAAFWLHPKIPVLGAAPINILALAAFVILGFQEPALWPLGAGLEIAFLFSLASTRRFQKWVDRDRLALWNGDTEVRRQALVAQLRPPVRVRMTNLERKAEQIIQLQEDWKAAPLLIEGNRDALRGLSWTYLKLLVARHVLEAQTAAVSEDLVERQIKNLEQDLLDDALPAALREAKTTTLAALRRRQASLEGREESLAEIDSDLLRIETQVDLALTNATLRQMDVIEPGFTPVSRMLHEDAAKDSDKSIAELEQSFLELKEIGPRALEREV